MNNKSREEKKQAMMDLLTMKTSKGGRKISLPWFRQTSVQQSHAALSRQHTIDTPGSFRAYVGSKKLQVNLLIKAFQLSFVLLLLHIYTFSFLLYS